MVLIKSPEGHTNLMITSSDWPVQNSWNKIKNVEFSSKLKKKFCRWAKTNHSRVGTLDTWRRWFSSRDPQISSRARPSQSSCEEISTRNDFLLLHCELLATLFSYYVSTNNESSPGFNYIIFISKNRNRAIQFAE